MISGLKIHFYYLYDLCTCSDLDQNECSLLHTNQKTFSYNFKSDNKFLAFLLRIEISLVVMLEIS